MHLCGRDSCDLRRGFKRTPTNQHGQGHRRNRSVKQTCRWHVCSVSRSAMLTGAAFPAGPQFSCYAFCWASKKKWGWPVLPRRGQQSSSCHHRENLRPSSAPVCALGHLPPRGKAFCCRTSETAAARSCCHQNWNSSPSYGISVRPTK